MNMAISPALFYAVTVNVVRDRKILPAPGTNQIAGFVTVPSWKKITAVMSREKTRFIGLSYRLAVSMATV